MHQILSARDAQVLISCLMCENGANIVEQQGERGREKEKWAQSNEINFIFNSKMPQSSFYGTGCSRCCSLLIFMNWKPKLPLPNWAALLLEHVSSLAELGNFYDLLELNFGRAKEEEEEAEVCTVHAADLERALWDLRSVICPRPWQTFLWHKSARHSTAQRRPDTVSRSYLANGGNCCQFATKQARKSQT